MSMALGSSGSGGGSGATGSGEGPGGGRRHRECSSAAGTPGGAPVEVALARSRAPRGALARPASRRSGLPGCPRPKAGWSRCRYLLALPGDRALRFQPGYPDLPEGPTQMTSEGVRVAALVPHLRRGLDQRPRYFMNLDLGFRSSRDESFRRMDGEDRANVRPAEGRQEPGIPPKIRYQYERRIPGRPSRGAGNPRTRGESRGDPPEALSEGQREPVS